MPTTRTLTWLMAITFLALFFLALPISPAHANPGILYIKVNGTSSWPCGQSNWSDACTLDTALANALPGDELWVAGGTYTPTVGVTRTATFQLRPGVRIYGGFAGGETERAQRNLMANTTILSGDIGTPGNSSDNAYHVVTGSGVTNTAVLDGFTVTGGNADEASPSPAIDCNDEASLANKCGAGMYNREGSPTVANVTFSGNSSIGYGGGMYNKKSSPALANVTFAGNTASQHGGGMHNYYSSPTLNNTTFTGNSAGPYGGGMYNEYWSYPIIGNTIFWGNTAASGSQIYNYDAISDPAVSDSVVQDGYTGGTHIITADPLLAPLGAYGSNTPLIPLLPGSSAINAGNACAATDQRGIPRPAGACDIGAFESRGFSLAKGEPSGDRQSAVVTHPFADPLRVAVSSFYGEPVNGGSVTFTAPTSGASVTPLSSTTTVTGGQASQSVTANGTAGLYTVSVETAGATAPIAFLLGNTQANSTTSLTSSANPSVRGQSLTFTAVVNGVSPSGSVTFQDGGAGIGCTNVPLSSGSAPCTITSPALGTHNITAAYSGDNNNQSSNGALTQFVNKASTSTSLGTHTPNPSELDAPLTVHFAVSVVPPGGGTPSGNVTVSDQTVQCTGALTAGAGSCALTFASPGAKTLTATYAGGGDFTASVSDSAPHIVNYPAPTLAAMAPTHGSAGGPAFTLTVTGTNFIVGSVVRWNSSDRSTAYVSPTKLTASILASDLVATGTANVTVYTPAPGGGVTGALPFTIENSNTMVALVSSVSPSVVGQSVDFTATVSGVSPTGMVSFDHEGTPITPCQNVPLTGGHATCNVVPGSAGTHSIGAYYHGDDNNHPNSSALAHIVNQASTTTVITSSQNPVSAGRLVTFTVTVSAVAPASGTPTGTVDLYEITSPSPDLRGTRRALTSQPLVNGIAIFDVPSLTLGSHKLLALYSGHADWHASASDPYTQNSSMVNYYLPLILR